MRKYGSPYMGNKSTIMPSLGMVFPKADHFYDLFGGGGSVSHYMALKKTHRYKYFHYNEINKLVFDLFRRAIAGEFSYDVFKPAWVSKEDFLRLRESDGYIRCLWSFGNSQAAYLFGENIEEYKRSMHMAVVFDEFDSLAAEVLGFGKWPVRMCGIKQRRLYLRNKIEFYRLNGIPKVLYRFLSTKKLDQLKKLEQLKQLERLQQLQQLEQLEQLQQLEQLERLQRLEITNLDYRDVEIKENSVIYCDIPYDCAAGKKYGDFDRAEFLDWAAACQHPVYISEYVLDDDRFSVVYGIEKRNLLSLDMTIVKEELLFWNRKELV